MFHNSSNIDASHSTFSEVHQDQHYNARITVQGNQTTNTIIHGNQIIQDSHSSFIEYLHKASAPSAVHDSAQRFPAPICIEGTRIDLLARIASWLDGADQKPICWLNGRPGSGKSAVSQTIAEKYAGEKRLAASFFFSRRDLERRTTQHVIPTLATQLMASLPSIRPALIATLENDYMIPTKVLREQMEKLLLGPLSTATEESNSPLLVVIDALDECDDETLVSELVVLLARLPGKTPLPLRLLITSRAEPWLQSQFHKPDISALTLHFDIHSFTAEGDIRSFLRRTLDDTYDQHIHVMQDVPRPWPSSDELECIVNKAGGLFIFALTVVKFVGDKAHNPTRRLQAILEDTAVDSADCAYADLDSLYRDAISTFPDPEVTRLILGLVYCMTIPMSGPGLEKLLKPLDIDIGLVVPALSSVLLASEDGKQPLQFYHASFRDFLINPLRAQKYAIKPDVYHCLIAQLCFEIMLSSLKRDMCGIGDPAKANNELLDLSRRRKEVFDETLSYACRFWSHHLAQLSNDSVVDEALLVTFKRFTTSVLLHWIEVLSIFGEVERAAMMLRECFSWLKTLWEVPEDVLTLIGEAERLVVLFMYPISECALHVYVTAISFFPKDGLIYRTFKHQSFGTLVMYPESIGDWVALRRDLRLHHLIHSITFSPNGNLFAIAGVNLGVQVWNTITCGIVTSLGDGSSTSLLVRFSPSGAFLAGAFEDGTVEAWDSKDGQQVMKHECCHTEEITCIEFSNKDAMLASGSRDRQIRVWSVETTQLLFRLATHEGPVTSFVFSSDSLRLFSGAEDNLVMVWDMSTGKVIGLMEGHKKAVNCVAVSGDGRTVASGSEDHTIKLWDITSGKCIQTLSKGHHTGIRSVHFFDKDKHIATACDEAILSWNIASCSTSETIWSVERLYKKLMKHVPLWEAKAIGWALPGTLLKYLFSQNDERSRAKMKAAFATTSPLFVFTHRRNPFPGSLVKPMNIFPVGDVGLATAVAISSDGNWAAAAGTSGQLQVFDLTVATPIWEDLEMTIEIYPLSKASAIVPSCDGKRFVIQDLTRWDLVDENQQIVKKLDLGRAHYDTMFKVSPNGNIFFAIVFGTFNDEKATLKVFDSDTGELLAQFSGLKKVNSFVSSADGSWIACANGVGQVDVFNVANKERTTIGKTIGSPIKVLTFSNDAQELVGGIESGVVCAWDRASGECKAMFEVSTSKVTALAYASLPSGGGRVAIGREDGSITLWSPSASASHDLVRSGQAIVKDVDLLLFSEDLSKLRSRGEDGTFFEWAVSLDADVSQCALCLRAKSSDGDADTTDPSVPHLLSRSDPGEALDCRFHTAYRIRKDGWLVKGDRRVIWIPPSLRPRGKNSFYASESGLVASFSRFLVFLKWVDE